MPTTINPATNANVAKSIAAARGTDADRASADRIGSASAALSSLRVIDRA